MNYFLSKPIRRPQLKRVLKEYCAPIPEENEDVSPSEALAKANGQEPANTIVVMNGVGSPSDEVQNQRNSLSKDGAEKGGALAEEIKRTDSPPISPGTNT